MAHDKCIWGYLKHIDYMAGVIGSTGLSPYHGDNLLVRARVVIICRGLPAPNPHLLLPVRVCGWQHHAPVQATSTALGHIGW